MSLTREQIEEMRTKLFTLAYLHPESGVDPNSVDALCDAALRSLDAQQNDGHSDSALSGGTTKNEG